MENGTLSNPQACVTRSRKTKPFGSPSIDSTRLESTSQPGTPATKTKSSNSIIPPINRPPPEEDRQIVLSYSRSTVPELSIDFIAQEILRLAQLEAVEEVRVYEVASRAQFVFTSRYDSYLLTPVNRSIEVHEYTDDIIVIITTRSLRR